jgi:acetyltransferase-like isoleucine patch superfamily enzyme
MRFKEKIRKLIYFFLGIFGAAFSDPKFSPKVLLRSILVQKIFRINGHVPWPVDLSSKIIAPDKIERGTRCPGLSRGCHLDGRNGIVFGKNVWVGPRVSVVSMNHDVCDYNQYITTSPVVIGDNCWLATGCTILPGVKLGDHVVVAAGAVVVKSFEESNIILGGVPAKIVKRIGEYDHGTS